MLTDYSLQESTIMIEDAREIDMDIFLDMMQEVKLTSRFFFTCVYYIVLTMQVERNTVNDLSLIHI